MHVTLIHPTTGEVRSIKIGFSWVLFFFVPFYGIPLFIRGLVAHGAGVATVGVAALLFQHTPLLPVIGLLLLAAMVFYGIKGNQLTVDHLASRGWYSPDDSDLGYADSGARFSEPDDSSEADAQANPAAERTCPRCAETVKAAARVCKHCGAALGSRNPRYPVGQSGSSGVGKAFLIGFGVLLFIVVAGLLIEQQDSSGDGLGTGFAANPFSSSASSEPAMAVTAEELFQAYADNEQAAQMTYGRGPLEVSGTIEMIELDIADEPMVSLAAGGMFEQVTLHFTQAYAADTAQLRRGQRFTARCTDIIEIMGFPQLRGCVPLMQNDNLGAAGSEPSRDAGDYLSDAIDFIAAHNNDPCGGYGEALDCDPTAKEGARSTNPHDALSERQASAGLPSERMRNPQAIETANSGRCHPDYLDADGYYRPPYGGVFFNQGSGCLRAPTTDDLQREMEKLRAQGLQVTEHYDSGY